MITVLEVGEIIKDGDELYDGGEVQWHPVKTLIGLPVTDGMWVRRPKKFAPNKFGSDGRTSDEYIQWCRENDKDPFPNYNR